MALLNDPLEEYRARIRMFAASRLDRLAADRALLDSNYDTPILVRVTLEPSPVAPDAVTCTQSRDSDTLFTESPSQMPPYPFAAPPSVRPAFDPLRDARVNRKDRNPLGTDTPNPIQDANRYARALNAIADAYAKSVACDSAGEPLSTFSLRLRDILQPILETHEDPPNRLEPHYDQVRDAPSFSRIRAEAEHFVERFGNKADTDRALIALSILAEAPGEGEPINRNALSILQALAHGDLLSSIQLANPDEWRPLNPRAEAWLAAYEMLQAGGHAFSTYDVTRGLEPGFENPPNFEPPILPSPGASSPWTTPQFPMDRPYWEAKRAPQLTLEGAPGRSDSRVIDTRYRIDLRTVDLAPSASPKDPGDARGQLAEFAPVQIAPVGVYIPHNDRRPRHADRVEVAFVTLPGQTSQRSIFMGGDAGLALRLIGLDWLVPPVQDA